MTEEHAHYDVGIDIEVTAEEKALLYEIAQEDGISVDEVLARLIRREAFDRSLRAEGA